MGPWDPEAEPLEAPRPAVCGVGESWDSASGEKRVEAGVTCLHPPDRGTTTSRPLPRAHTDRPGPNAGSLPSLLREHSPVSRKTLSLLYQFPSLKNFLSGISFKKLCWGQWLPALYLYTAGDGPWGWRVSEFPHWDLSQLTSQPRSPPTPAAYTLWGWGCLPRPSLRVILKITWGNRKHCPTCKASWNTCKRCVFHLDRAPFSLRRCPGSRGCSARAILDKPSIMDSLFVTTDKRTPPHRVNQRRVQEGKHLSLGDSGHRAFSGSFHQVTVGDQKPPYICCWQNSHHSTGYSWLYSFPEMLTPCAITFNAHVS